MKATRAQQTAISTFVEDTFTYEICKLAEQGKWGSYTFTDLKAEIKAVFGELEFNWMTVVRSPMQKLINDGFMKRDTSDLTVERYIKA